MVSANDKLALGLSLSGGNEHDAPEGRKLITSMIKPGTKTRLLMDKAYEGDETRKTAEELGIDIEEYEDLLFDTAKEIISGNF